MAGHAADRRARAPRPAGRDAAADLLAVAIGLLALAGFLVAAQLAFNHGTIITVVYRARRLLAILATALIHGVTVAFEREQARDAFARFVPEAVVDEVLARRRRRPAPRRRASARRR